MSAPSSECIPAALIPELVAPSPTIIWIELTSKCPFDCVFCSRKQERGNGMHMSFTLYESLIRQLHRPEMIRLNYSGESTHYPRLADAVRLARGTGAMTELVSALASASRDTLKGLVDNGLHRLSVSIHSMDSDQFRRIYRFGDIADTRDRLEWLNRYKAAGGRVFPEIDFAFVAMEGNLDQLLSIAEYARDLGVSHVSVHPVIRRSEIPIQFPAELDERGHLRTGFESRIHEEVDRVTAHVREVTITVARPESKSVAPHAALPNTMTTCEQNPWETVHVLADGAVVVCEVHDRHQIGNLRSQTLSEIWHGPEYQAFRREYVNQQNATCNACPWRNAVELKSNRQLLFRGWHPMHAEETNWSQSSAAIVIAPPSSAAAVVVAGVVPPLSENGVHNALTIRSGSAPPVRLVNATAGMLPFKAEVPLPHDAAAGPVVLRFETQHRFSPAEQGVGSDLRRLGFALTGLTIAYDESRRKHVRHLLKLLRQVESVKMLPGGFMWSVTESGFRTETGVSVFIPARDTPDLLNSVLRAAEAALARVGEPSEIVVFVSGVARPDSDAWADLRREFPGVTWIFREKPLHYGAAVEAGLRTVRYPWVYLLNSDMLLNPGAIETTLALRSPEIFAIGTRILMEDGSNTETNWTDLQYAGDDAAELIERDPSGLRSPRGCLYVGGGSGLFRRSLLRRFAARTRAYAPFYWEDVEWGALAWRYGYSCVFCPDSLATHGRRRTVARYFNDREVEAVFERNRLRFHLRNLTRLTELEERLLSLDRQDWSDLVQPRALLDTLWARTVAFSAPHREDVLFDRWKMSF